MDDFENKYEGGNGCYIHKTLIHGYEVELRITFDEKDEDPWYTGHMVVTSTHPESLIQHFGRDTYTKVQQGLDSLATGFALHPKQNFEKKVNEAYYGEKKKYMKRMILLDKHDRERSGTRQICLGVKKLFNKLFGS